MTCPACHQPATLAGVTWRCERHGNLVRLPVDHRQLGHTEKGQGSSKTPAPA